MAGFYREHPEPTFSACARRASRRVRAAPARRAGRSYNARVLRRKRLPDDLAESGEGFAFTLRLVESAKESIATALPTSRTPGRALGEALFAFEEDLRDAGGTIDGWWHPAVASEWEPCRDGILESLRRAERLRLDAPELSFDQMAFTIQDLIAPLEPFEDAAVVFRALRT